MDIFGSDQTRREKARKAATQAESSIERSTSGRKSIGPLCGARGCRREEASVIGCWQSGDCEGGEEAVGEGSGGEEESRLILAGIIWPPFSRELGGFFFRSVGAVRHWFLRSQLHRHLVSETNYLTSGGPLFDENVLAWVEEIGESADTADL
jgi:hypothetical protein